MVEMSAGLREHRNSFHRGYQEGFTEEVTFEKGLEGYGEGPPRPLKVDELRAPGQHSVMQRA